MKIGHKYSKNHILKHQSSIQISLICKIGSKNRKKIALIPPPPFLSLPTHHVLIYSTTYVGIQMWLPSCLLTVVMEYLYALACLLQKDALGWNTVGIVCLLGFLFFVPAREGRAIDLMGETEVMNFEFWEAIRLQK